MREVVNGVLGFLENFMNILGGAMNPQATEGIIAIFCIAVVWRIFEDGVKIPRIRRRREGDEEEEWVLVRRRRS